MGNQEKKCLILGGAGFLGKNLCYGLLKKGYQLFVYSRPSKQLELFRKQFPSVTVIQGNFQEEQDFSPFLKDMDFVFHLISSTNPTNKDLLLDFTMNVMPTLRFIEACREHDCRILFFSSGGTVYGIPEQVPILESNTLKPISSYGIQKATIERCVEYYGWMYGLDFMILRVSNPYGAWQNPFSNQGAIAVFTAKALLGERISIWGDGSAVRDYIYVDDLMQACWHAMQYEGPYRTFNVGSGTGYSLRKILEVIGQATGKRLNVEYIGGRVQDVPSNVLDMSLAQREWGWQVETGLVQGIQRMVEMWNPVDKAYVRKGLADEKV